MKIKSIIKRKILKSYYYGKTKSNEIFLTFDDGPSPDVIEQIITDGHTLANHSYSHFQLAKQPLFRTRKEIKKVNDCLKQKHEVKLNLFRPPQGRINWKILLLVLKKRMKLKLWSRDSNDYQVYNSAPEIIEEFKNAPPKIGDVILFHDDNEKVISVLEKMLPEWQKEFNFKALT